MAKSLPEKPNMLPKPPVEKWLTPVRQFLHIESASGIVLLVCTVIALVLANSPLYPYFKSIWKTEFTLRVGDFELVGDLGHLIVNDGLMTIFFFLIGLEIKREIVIGELRDIRKAMLPIFAALGGMIAPALIFLSFQYGQPGQRGWAIPMATDIAFVVGFLALFGPRVPFSLKIMLLSLAIVDDLGAVLVIAFVYTGALSFTWLGLGLLGLGVTYFLNRIGVRNISIYVLVGAFVWLAIYKSGVHPTVAGVLLGLLTPSTAWIENEKLLQITDGLSERLRNYKEGDQQRYADLKQLSFAAREATSPLHRIESNLHPWVGFVIMPLFALANAGVVLDLSSVADPVSYSIAAGLAIGKPLGIVFFSWLAIQLGLTVLPTGVSWKLFAGGACLGGIGFTMALFINGLAFPVSEFPAKEAAGKIGTLVGSVISAVLGSVLLFLAVRKKKLKELMNEEDDTEESSSAELSASS